MTGRNTTVAVVAFIAVAMIGWGLNNDLYRLIGFGVIGLIAIATMVGNWLFAAKHPEAAMLEGAEFARVRMAQMAAKGLGDMPPSPGIAPPDGSIDGDDG